VNPLLTTAASPIDSGQPVTAHRARVARVVVGVERNPIWGVGGTCAHERRRATVRFMVAGTLGRRRDSSGRGETLGDGEAHGTVGWAGGGQSASVDDELIGEEAATEEMLMLSIVADSSSSQR
jgi:hypothetical protein